MGQVRDEELRLEEVKRSKTKKQALKVKNRRMPVSEVRSPGSAALNRPHRTRLSGDMPRISSSKESFVFPGFPEAGAARWRGDTHAGHQAIHRKRDGHCSARHRQPGRGKRASVCCGAHVQNPENRSGVYSTPIVQCPCAAASNSRLPRWPRVELCGRNPGSGRRRSYSGRDTGWSNHGPVCHGCVAGELDEGFGQEARCGAITACEPRARKRQQP